MKVWAIIWNTRELILLTCDEGQRDDDQGMTYTEKSPSTEKKLQEWQLIIQAIKFASHKDALKLSTGMKKTQNTLVISSLEEW